MVFINVSGLRRVWVGRKKIAVTTVSTLSGRVVCRPDSLGDWRLPISIDLHPDEKRAYFKLGRLYWRNGNIEKAHICAVHEIDEAKVVKAPIAA